MPVTPANQPSDPQSTNLRAAIDNLYATFAHYRGQSGWGDILASPKMEVLLQRHTIRELPPKAFTHFASDALSLSGPNEPALKYFLPRILDNSGLASPLEPASPGDTGVDANMLVSKLNEVHWLQWPEQERGAIEVFFHECLRFQLQSDCSPWGSAAGEILMHIAFSGLSLQPALEIFDHDLSPTASLHLAHLVTHDEESLAGNADLQSWQFIWGEESTPLASRHQFVRWLITQQNLTRLENAFFAANSPPRQETLSSAVEALRNILRSWQILSGTSQIPDWAKQAASHS